MDINLTGQIAATLAENLKQSSYNPFINIIAGIAGGLVTGIITLIAIKITNDNTKRRDEQNRKHDLKVKVYFELLDELYLLMNSVHGLNQLPETFKNVPMDITIKTVTDLFSKSQMYNASILNLFAKIQVIGNKKILEKSVAHYGIIKQILVEGFSKTNVELLSNAQTELTNEIREELLGEGFSSSEAFKPKSWWQFWK